MIMRLSMIGGVIALMLASCAPVVSPAAQEADVEITLTRGACYGACPVYEVSITGDGAVTYEGRRFVNVLGVQRAVVSREEVGRLVERFDAVAFVSLRDEYRAEVTDLPTYTLTLERNGRAKTVVDYAGLDVGMPRAVRELQNEVDRVAGTAQWVLRDGQPVQDRPEP